MKAVTERNPKVVGIIAVVVMTACVLAILLLNRSFFSSGYTDRRAVHQRRRHLQGHRGDGGRRQRGLGHARSQVHGNAVDAQLSVNHSVVLPHTTTAAIEVETLLGVVDVTLEAGERVGRSAQAGGAHHRHVGADRVLPTAEHRALAALQDERARRSTTW